MTPASRTTASHPYYVTNSTRLHTTTVSTPQITASRPTTARTTTSQQVVCAVVESRGISPAVGVASLNLATCEATLCQITDNQFYSRTFHRLSVLEPTFVIVRKQAVNLGESQLTTILDDELGGSCALEYIDSRYFQEGSGYDCINQYALAEDVEAIKVSVKASYYAVSSLAAVFHYVNSSLHTAFPLHCIRMRHQPPESTMYIPIPTINGLELFASIDPYSPKSTMNLYSHLNRTQSAMGSRLLCASILHPSTEQRDINNRLEAVQELTTNEEMFYGIRNALKGFVDADKVLTDLVRLPTEFTPGYREQSINRIIALKTFLDQIPAVCEALAGAQSHILRQILQSCVPDRISPFREIIDCVLNSETVFAKSALELRRQRIYAIKSGIDSVMDLARQAFGEAEEDAYEHVKALATEYNLALDIKYDPNRRFYIVVAASQFLEQSLPVIFTNRFKRKGNIECQTLELIKLNRKLNDCEIEVLVQGEATINELTERILQDMCSLFKCSDGIAQLDMLWAFAHVSTSFTYVRPKIDMVLGIEDGRHPLLETSRLQKFIPNDVYASSDTRFQIITGCNMSGKSTYVRMIAMISIMTQIGCFVPATKAYVPILHQLHARTSLDNISEPNVSTFSAEMREMALILRNVDQSSLVVVDELGRATSSRDGLCIALAISEALLNSKSLVFFVTHYQELSRILQGTGRNGIVSYHLAVDQTPSVLTMQYRLAPGIVDNQHYGIEVAKLFGLPQNVIDKAMEVSKKLSEQKPQSNDVAYRRRLVLALKNHLEQARDSALSNDELRVWVKKLQEEFVSRMSR